MNPTGDSVFRRSLLASGLLAPETVAGAENALRALAAHGSSTVTAPTAEQLANYIVAEGLLNSWQVEQLRHGRSKFSLGPYLVIDSIGQGGMGQVFKAEHTIMGRIVAIKVLPRHRSTPDSIASFHREIRAQAQLDHHNLVRALDAGHDGNVHFLVTEYVPGADLRKLVRNRGKLSMQAAASIISQAAQGLGHAHAKGMIHRDIKPGNLLVTPEGVVKVSDLGLVGYFGDSPQPDAHSGKIVGTADYLSPEQVIATDKVGPASDLYSLGCTLYYAVTGKVPFPGGSTRDKAHAHCHLQPLDPRRLNPELSTEFVEVLAAMMAKQIPQRIGTTAEVVSRLAPWVSGDAARLTPSEFARPGSATNTATATQWLSPRSLEPDNEPPFVVRTDRDESPSQVSQATHPLSAASEETVPAFEVEPRVAPRPSLFSRWLGDTPAWVKLLVVGGLVVAAGTVGAMVYEALR